MQIIWAYILQFLYWRKHHKCIQNLGRCKNWKQQKLHLAQKPQQSAPAGKPTSPI
jgi:hypothetical protein